MRVSTAIALVTVSVLLVITAAAGVCAAERLKISGDCGTIEFVGSKDDGSHKGGFKEFSGEVTLNPEGPSLSDLVIEIKTTSLWSDDPKLTAHLRTADFFHIDKFPNAVFRSTAVRKAEEQDRKAAENMKATHVIQGKLTLLGVTREIDVPVTVTPSDASLGIRGDYRLDRTQFGMEYGAGKIHDEVKVSFALKIPR